MDSVDSMDKVVKRKPAGLVIEVRNHLRSLVSEESGWKPTSDNTWEYPISSLPASTRKFIASLCKQESYARLKIIRIKGPSTSRNAMISGDLILLEPSEGSWIYSRKTEDIYRLSEEEISHIPVQLKGLVIPHVDEGKTMNLILLKRMEDIDSETQNATFVEKAKP